MTMIKVFGKPIELEKEIIEEIEKSKAKQIFRDLDERCPELLDWLWYRNIKKQHID